MFARSYPREWRRAEMIPGLRRRVLDWVRQIPDVQQGLQQAALMLGYGRPLDDDQWRAWAEGAFALLAVDAASRGDLVSTPDDLSP
jgi:hypothetical protein